MNKKFLVPLIIVLTIIAFAFFKLHDSGANTTTQDPSKGKHFCDSRTNINCNDNKPPKGVCIPGGVCTSS